MFMNSFFNILKYLRIKYLDICKLIVARSSELFSEPINLANGLCRRIRMEFGFTELTVPMIKIVRFPSIERIFFLILVLGTSQACKTENPDPPDPGIFEEGVFIINEGNFQQGNASLDFYDPKKDSVIKNIFSSENDRPLGDLFQSMTIHNSKAYLVINNSQKIEIVEKDSMRSLQTISGFISPRYMLIVDDNKAYVSDLFGNEMAILDLQNFNINGKVALPGWTEAMIKADKMIWVSNWSREYVYLIDPSSDTVADSVKVGLGGNSMVVDKDGMLWLLAEGDAYNGIAGGMYKIDPQKRETVLSLPMTTDDFATELSISPDGSKLYYLNNAVFEMAVSSTSLPVEAFIPAESRSLYGLGVDPTSGEIYVSDAIDFVQSSSVFRYNDEGELITTFKAGIISGDFYFKN